jgi:predicted NBD/HSP70 family sugar kinase
LARQHNTTADCFALYELVIKGDETAQKVYEIWQNRLSEALIQLNDLFDTQKIVLAGSLAEIADYELLQEKINKRSFGEAPLITKSGGLNFPALVGAALLWYDAYVK